MNIGDLIRIPFGRHWFTGIILKISKDFSDRKNGTLGNPQCIITLLNSDSTIKCFEVHSQHFYEILNSVNSQSNVI